MGVGGDKSNLSHKYADKKYEVEIEKLPDHNAAMELVLQTLTGKEHGVISDLSEIGAVGHRVLHGGEKFTASSCLIDDAVIAAIEENIPLGPLHNPANLMGIRACQKVLPDVPQVAVFDTAFHQTMEPKAYRYAIPNEYYTDLHIRKYGFHGTSHRYIAARSQELLGLPKGNKVIICHLGNGSSLSACVDGKCTDTSMGLTPLDGLVIDPLGHAGPGGRRVHLQPQGHDRQRVPEYAQQEERPAGAGRLLRYARRHRPLRRRRSRRQSRH